MQVVTAVGEIVTSLPSSTISHHFELPLVLPASADYYLATVGVALLVSSLPSTLYFSFLPPVYLFLSSLPGPLFP